jgi:hypothetical protein
MSTLLTKQTLNQLLLTYRSTPNPNVPHYQSLAEALIVASFERDWTGLLLQPRKLIERDEKMEAAYNTKQGANTRQSVEEQAVRYRIHNKRNEAWRYGTVLESIG